jgi:hypothetical protein
LTGQYVSLDSALLFTHKPGRPAMRRYTGPPKRPGGLPAARRSERPSTDTSRHAPKGCLPARKQLVTGEPGATPRPLGHMTWGPCAPLNGCRACGPAQPGESPENSNGVDHVHNSGPFGSRRDGTCRRFFGAGCSPVTNSHSILTSLVGKTSFGHSAMPGQMGPSVPRRDGAACLWHACWAATDRQ